MTAPHLVVLDRDGVINHERGDFVKTVAEMILIPRSAEAIARLNARQVKVAVATNQSAIGRGIFDEPHLHVLHDHLQQELQKQRARLDHIFFCGDHPDAATPRRKPAAGMLIEAMAHFSVLPAHTVFIGDSLTDLQAARAANVTGLLVRTGKGAATARALPADFVGTTLIFDDLYAAIEHLFSSAAR